MVEQRTIIDHKLYHILIHPNANIEKREEYILKPIEYGGHYFAEIPNFINQIPILVNKDSQIKVVYFNRE